MLFGFVLFAACIALCRSVWAASPVPEDVQGTWHPYSASVQDHPGAFTLHRRTIRLLGQTQRVAAVERNSPDLIVLELEAGPSGLLRMEIYPEAPLSSLSRQAARVLFYEHGDQNMAGIEGWYQR